VLHYLVAHAPLIHILACLAYSLSYVHCLRSPLCGWAEPCQSFSVRSLVCRLI